MSHLVANYTISKCYHESHIFLRRGGRRRNVHSIYTFTQMDYYEDRDKCVDSWGTFTIYTALDAFCNVDPHNRCRTLTEHIFSNKKSIRPGTRLINIKFVKNIIEI